MIPIRCIKENIFFINERQSYTKEIPTEAIGRKVRVGFFYNDVKKHFYRRLLACIIILKSSRKFQEDYPNLFDEILNREDDPSNYPDALDNLRKVDQYLKIRSNRIDKIEVPKSIAYLLFMLISFYNLNGLLNDYYLMFNRTFAYEKEQLVIQKWDSLLKDDFLLYMLIFGLDELELSENSSEFFESLQERYIEKSAFYQKVIQERELRVTKSFKKSVNIQEFLITDDDKTRLRENEVFENLKKMTAEERKQTEELILSLFIFNVSNELRQKIEEISYQGSQILGKQLSLVKAIKKAQLNEDLIEYQRIQPLEQTYRYIDEDIASMFADKNIAYKLKPFFE